jgi:hypothetical protein
MALSAHIGTNAQAGRWVPPFSVTRPAVAGQYTIGSYVATNQYYLTGANISRSGATVSLTVADSQGTVQAGPPKGGGTNSAIINVKRTPYTYYGHGQHTPYCGTHYHDGQCAAGGSHYSWAGPYKNATPADHSDSEGEWWRIW